MRYFRAAIVPGIFLVSIILFGLAELVFAQNRVEMRLDPPQVGLPPDNQPSAERHCHLSGEYPKSILQWCAEIESVSIDTGLDSNVIAAVMLQESGGNPSVISSSGAVGLLQVMPRDGQAAEFMCANGPCFSSRPSMNELLDPGFNIQYGAEYLAALLTVHDNLREALMRYGPYDVGYAYADKVLAIMASHDG